MSSEFRPQWADLLRKAVSEPGKISTAYSRFHEYSVGNQMLAFFQCSARSIEPGPIGTFMHWKQNGRHVKKGEKAITLCMPMTRKRKADSETEDDAPESYTIFTYRNNWFVLSQTEGTAYTPEPTPGWDDAKAIDALGIQKVPFTMSDGNCHGYAQKRSIAISPLAEHPARTTFHEIAHIVLGHTVEGQMNDGGERTPRDIRELEAECVAMLCCASLGLPGEEFSRGYIQSWFHSREVPEKSAQKIFHAADIILKAGRI